MTLKEFKQIEDLLDDKTEILIIRDKSKKNPIGFQAPEGKEVVPVAVNDT